MFELDAGIGGGEAPVHRPGVGVAGLFPGGHLAGQGVGVADAAVQALPAQPGSQVGRAQDVPDMRSPIP